MVWVHAGWCVAVMQDIQSVWDWATKKYPRQSVCVSRPVSTLVLSPHPKTSVAIVVQLGLPEPTSISLQNLRPETFFEWYSRWSHDVIPPRISVWLEARIGSEPL